MRQLLAYRSLGQLLEFECNPNETMDYRKSLSSLLHILTMFHDWQLGQLCIITSSLTLISVTAFQLAP